MNEKKKHILLYLGKFPGYGADIDGGSILARQLIDSLKEKSILDVVFIRKNKEIFKDIYVNQVRYVEYKDAKNNKFIRRLENLDTNRKAIADYHKYDLIITAHISKFFGFENEPDSFWNKTILFPMFCSPSYRKAGEFVPIKYTQQERFVFKKVNQIIVPSFSDKLDIVSYYNVPEDKISIIHRGIDPLFQSCKKEKCSDILQIVCIGSIKKQKNNIDAINVLQKIRDIGVNAVLHFVCTIQDIDLYTQLQQFIEDKKLSDMVHFHYGLSQEEVSNLLQTMDINISVSNWETFGRGIFEGIASGIPTFIYSRLKSVHEIIEENEGVYFAEDSDDMANAIVAVYNNQQLYSKMAISLVTLADVISYKRERELLQKAILLSEN